MILAYHRINPWHKKDALTVSPDRFEMQIEYLLKKKWKFESLSFLIAQRKFCFSITFDDGFADNLWFALPILKKFNISGVIFLTVGYIETERIFPRYNSYEKDRFLKWSEVKVLIKEGIEIGSHSITHSHLTQIPLKEAKKEIENSKKIIEDKTGKEVKYFCYPYGDFNKKIMQLVEESGYELAVVTPSKKIKNTKLSMIRTGIYGHNNLLSYRIKIWRNYLKEKLF